MVLGRPSHSPELRVLQPTKGGERGGRKRERGNANKILQCEFSMVPITKGKRKMPFLNEIGLRRIKTVQYRD